MRIGECVGRDSVEQAAGAIPLQETFRQVAST
jgi:hypothetical protein